MPAPSGPRDPAVLLVALVTTGLGIFVLVGTRTIALGAGYDRIGPRFFPLLVALGLIASGVLLLRETLGGRGRPAIVSAANARSLVLACFGLFLSVLLLERAGFVVTSTVLFWLTARAFESRRGWRDLLVGAVLSIVVYLAFTRGLGLVLPTGVF